METLAALGRMSVSLVAVVGLIWLISRWLRKAKTGAAAQVTVLSRTSVGHKAGVAVVQVGGRALVVGVTEHQVSLLTDVPLESVLPEGGEEDTDAGEAPHVTIEIPAQSTAFSAELALQSAAVAADMDGITHTDAGAPAPARTPRGASRAEHSPALAGSALSPATWAKAVNVLRERTNRR